MSAVDILVRAEELLYEQDWSPTSHRGVNGPRCVFWAISDAEDQVELNPIARFHAHAAFREAIGVPSPVFISEWNDAPGRTVAEVFDAFGCAIRLAKEREAAQ